MLAQALHARFLPRDYATGLAFVAAVGAAAEQADHHPDITLTYTAVDLSLVSHDVRRVTRRDVDLARRISAIARERGIAASPGAVSQVELALDTADLAAVGPFWAALLTGTHPVAARGRRRRPDGAPAAAVVPGHDRARDAAPALPPRPVGRARRRARADRGRGGGRRAGRGRQLRAVVRRRWPTRTATRRASARSWTADRRSAPPRRPPAAPGQGAQPAVAPRSTASVGTAAPRRPGAASYCQYRFVWAMIASGAGAPQAVWSSVVWASLTSVAS